MKRVILIFALVTLPHCIRAHPGPEDETSPDPEKNSTNTASRVSIAIEGDQRVIRANGLPNHATGRFPNRGNPNRIAAQNYVFRVPAHPNAATEPTPLRMHPFGVAVNGVVFDPGAAEWWDDDPSSGWQYEALSGAINLGVDQNNAHVQPNGAYHYHGVPAGLLDQLTGGQSKMVLLGWAADGFPIYGPWGYADPMDAKAALKKVQPSYHLKKGPRPNGPRGAYDGTFVQDYEFVAKSGDLDECNGRFGVTPEFPQGTYHYYITGDYPFIPRLFKGTPDSSFFRHGPPGGRPPRGKRPPGRGERGAGFPPPDRPPPPPP